MVQWAQKWSSPGNGWPKADHFWTWIVSGHGTNGAIFRLYYAFIVHHFDSLHCIINNRYYEVIGNEIWACMHTHSFLQVNHLLTRDIYTFDVYFIEQVENSKKNKKKKIKTKWCPR